MNEKQLGDALLHFDARSNAGRMVLAPDPRVLMAGVVRRDGRRVRRLAALAAALWLLAAAGVPLFFWFLWLFVDPKLKQVAASVGGDERVIPADALAGVIYQAGYAVAWVGMVLFTASVVALLLAGLSTVLLVFASRRATLRQINANLVQVSEDVRLLREMIARERA